LRKLNTNKKHLT